MDNNTSEENTKQIKRTSSSLVEGGGNGIGLRRSVRLKEEVHSDTTPTGRDKTGRSLRVNEMEARKAEEAKKLE